MWVCCQSVKICFLFLENASGLFFLLRSECGKSLQKLIELFIASIVEIQWSLDFMRYILLHIFVTYKKWNILWICGFKQRPHLYGPNRIENDNDHTHFFIKKNKMLMAAKCYYMNDNCKNMDEFLQVNNFTGQLLKFIRMKEKER